MRFASFAQKCAQRANFLYNKVFMPSAVQKWPENPALPQFYNVAGRRLPLKLVPHARAKRLTLRLEPGGRGLRITTPPQQTDNAAVLHFIRRHHGWLEKRLTALPAADAANAPEVKDGGFIPFLGQNHRIIHCQGRGLTALHSQGDERQILVYGQKQFLARHIRDFLKKQAEKTLAPLVAGHAAAVNRAPRSVSYKDTKTRWGSCSSERKLAFSWRIIMAPIGVIDYLAAHEAAHMVEMNHSQRFWTLCEKLCPETKKHRAWLKQNGQKLHAIAFDETA